ncbi:ras-related and estrogen-regulated growth inhibitor-like protein [Oratosquilla oratoria]|uniref:ras-related and estrogen-regulated growth inhibitor-like protein n=1 Tax=Oratosquilla oratoria TaxID=337810 RepID=UPI003F75DFEE
MPTKQNRSNHFRSSLRMEDPVVRIAVLGPSQVGKSALTVRYLTKRFIGEYRSDTDMLYKSHLKVDTTVLPVEIMDAAPSSDESSSTSWAEAFVVVYSIDSCESFRRAREILEKIRSCSIKGTPPILLLGNKSDLHHLREVEEAEARSLALSHSARFSEVSAAESSTDVTESLDAFLKEIKISRSQSSSPRTRKLSVSRMLGSLMGRSSPPPAPITELIILDKNERSKLKAPIRYL